MDLEQKVAVFEEAFKGLSYLTSVDLATLAERLDGRLIDGIENGKAQKFEYCLQAALREREGIDESSPKKVIKAYYLAGQLSEDDYVALIAAVDDRNKLSHIYDAEHFMAIVQRLPHYADVLSRLLVRLKEPVTP